MNLKNLNVLVFVSIIFFLGGINLFVSKGPVLIETENRMSSNVSEFSMENFFSGEYLSGFENYFADNFALRNFFIGITQKTKAFEGILIGDTVEIVEYSGANVVQDTDWGKILIYDNSAMEINYFNETAAKNYAKSINAYSERFPELNIYSLLVPTQIDFIEDNDYCNISDSQKETISKTQEYLNDEVILVDVWQNMYDHREEYLFFRTDHHWTQRGAFYAYQVLAELMGEEKPNLYDYEITIYKDYLGSLYLVTKSEKLKKQSDYIEVIDPKIPHDYFGVIDEVMYNEGKVFVEKWLETEEKYGVFMGGDYPLLKIETEQDSKRNILVLKDSYANAFIPFMMSLADNIVVIDPRLFEGEVDTIIEEYQITDIMFLNYALITRNDGYGELYLNLLK